MVDNRKTVYNFWLLLEDVSHIEGKRDTQHAKRFDNTDDVFEKGDQVRSFNLPTDTTEPVVKAEVFSRPSLYANQMSNSLNYPLQIYIIDNEITETHVNASVELLNHPLPCDVHLLTLRTQPDSVYTQFPSANALMVLHRQGYECSVHSNFKCDNSDFEGDAAFSFLTVRRLQSKTLTGTETVRDNLRGLSDLALKPMSIQTLNITFG